MKNAALVVIAAMGLGLQVTSADGQTLPAAQKAVDPFTDNLLVDGELRYAATTAKDAAPKVYLRTPNYWKLKIGDKELSGHDLPFDKEVKFVGDCSIRLDGTGGTTVFTKTGWGDTRDYMRHAWAYTASVRLKLKDVKGKVHVGVGYSWGKAASKDFSGTMDWTQVPLDFVCDRDTNLLQAISVTFESTGTVWIDDLQLRMKDADAFKWWQSWNATKRTARLGEAVGADEKAGVLTTQPAQYELDAYGGLKSVKSKASGAFRCEKIDGKWWLITPDGHGFFKTAMFDPTWTAYPNYNQLLERIGGRDAWSVQTLLRIRSWGFNSIEWGPSFAMNTARGPRAPKEIAGVNMPYTSNARFELCTDPARNGGIKVPAVDWGWGQFADVFSDEFARAIEAYGTPKQKGSHFVPRPEDPWLIGYLLADEPRWYGPEVWYGSLTDGFHGLPADSPGKKRWLEMLKEKYGEIGKLNAAWAAGFKSWDDFAATKKLPRNKTSVDDRRQFMGLIAERWYGLAAAQIRKYDTKHMVLGGNATRLYPTVYAAESKNVDVLCASLYNLSGLYRPHPDFGHYINDQVYTWTGKPIMTGYIVGQGDDGGFPDTGRTENGAQRGHSYVSFLRQMAASEAVVGVFWWTYVSWPEPNNEGYTKSWGAVTPDNRPYMDLLPYLQQANDNAYAYRTGKAPAAIEPPTIWQPTHGQLAMWPEVPIRLTPLPYKVGKYEVELAKTDGTDARVMPVENGDSGLVARVQLANGAYRLRARSVAGGKDSGWGVPVEFAVAGKEEAGAIKATNGFLHEGRNWKTSVVQNEKETVEVAFEANVRRASDGGAVLAAVVPAGQSVKQAKFEARLPQPLVLKKGVPYSFRVRFKADTEAGAVPRLSLLFAHGYDITPTYSPIDKGWLVQRALSGDRVTHGRASVRLPRDMPLEGLAISLLNCTGRVAIVGLEVEPEAEYEVGPTLLDDYQAIVKEFRSLAK